MNKVAESQILLQKLPRPRVPIKLLLIMGLVLIIAVSFVVSSNIRHDQERIQVAMKNRADVLIWALEGGVRSMAPEGRGGPAWQTFVEEVAKQPSIAYLAITDQTGTVLVHSNPEKVGTKLHTAQEMQKYCDLTESEGCFTRQNHQEIYEVAKLFVPVMPVMGKGHGHNGGMGNRHGFLTLPDKPGKPDKPDKPGKPDKNAMPPQQDKTTELAEPGIADTTNTWGTADTAGAVGTTGSVGTGGNFTTGGMMGMCEFGTGGASFGNFPHSHAPLEKSNRFSIIAGNEVKDNEHDVQ